MLEMKEAKLLFESGGLRKAKIVDDPMSEGWIILFEKKDANNGNKWSDIAYTTRRLGCAKDFKDLKAAVNVVKKIGFNSVEVCNLQY